MLAAAISARVSMDVVFLKCEGEWVCNGSMLLQRPRGPMDKASAYGAGDCRFESCRGHSLLDSKHVICICVQQAGLTS